MKHTRRLPAGTGEKTQYLVHDFNDNTIRLILHYPGRPDSAVLRSAIKNIIARVDVLHSSFCAGAVRAYWNVNEVYDETLTWIAWQTKKQKEDPLAGMEGMPLLHGVVRTFPMGMLKRAVRYVYGSMAVGLTNLGALKAEEFALGNLKPDVAVFGGPLKRKPAMQVSVISLDGNCALCVAGEMAPEDENLIDAMLRRMCREVEEFAGGNADGRE